MKTSLATLCVLLGALLAAAGAFAAESAKPALKVTADGFPSGHGTPEGAACDLARAFIGRDVALFKETCIPPFGGGEQRGNYETFLEKTAESMKEEAARKEPSPGGPKAIVKVFAARHLTKNGPVSMAYALFDFRDLMFVDLQTQRQNGDLANFRILTIKKADDKWYVYPTPQYNELMTMGLNSESESTQDFSEAYQIEK